jgi:hypothetical protein
MVSKAEAAAREQNLSRWVRKNSAVTFIRLGVMICLRDLH